MRPLGILALVVLTAGCAPSDPVPVPPYTTPSPSHYLRNKGSDRVIVFVHGVLGDARATWTAPNGAYWPSLLLDDDAFKDFDVYVYDYPSPFFAVGYSIDELADNLRLFFESDSVFDNHKQVLFLCHSVGGLVSRALLLKYQQLAAKVPMMYFFSTPTTGSELTALARSVGSRNSQFADMKTWKDNAYVGNLVRQWQAAQFRIQSYCAYEKRATFGVKVVDEQSATNLCNQRLDPIDADHIDVVKPADRSAVPYLAFRQAVLRTSFVLPPPPRPPAPRPAPPSTAVAHELTCKIAHILTLIGTNPDKVTVRMKAFAVSTLTELVDQLEKGRKEPWREKLKDIYGGAVAAIDARQKGDTRQADFISTIGLTEVVRVCQQYPFSECRGFANKGRTEVSPAELGEAIRQLQECGAKLW